MGWIFDGQSVGGVSVWMIANVSWNGTFPRCELGACGGSPFGEEAEKTEDSLMGVL